VSGLLPTTRGAGERDTARTQIQSVKLKADELVVFSYIVYESRTQRDRVNKKVMADPRMADMMDPKSFPFDGKRMFWGGFKPIVRL
jgi:uncharacterized protein YbaA (DUF1428 family)